MQAALRKLFYRIDANSDGTVDWDEFSQYMLLENQGMAAIMENKQRRELRAPAVPRNRSDAAHSKMMECCAIIPPCGGCSSRYATGARDGTVKLWECKVRHSEFVAPCLYDPLSCASAQGIAIGCNPSAPPRIYMTAACTTALPALRPPRHGVVPCVDLTCRTCRSVAQ